MPFPLGWYKFIVHNMIALICASCIIFFTEINLGLFIALMSLISLER